MKDQCLISVEQLCKDGFAVNFDTKNILLLKVKHVLVGYRYSTTNLYLFVFDNPQPLPSIYNHSALALSTLSPRPSKICAYYLHDMTKNLLGPIPTPICMEPSPNNLDPKNRCCFYATWPGLTAALFRDRPHKVSSRPRDIYIKNRRNSSQQQQKTAKYHDGSRRT